MDKEDLQYVTYLLEKLKIWIPDVIEAQEYSKELVSYVSEKALAVELASAENQILIQK